MEITGGKNIYGNKFEDEHFFYTHSREGLLSMLIQEVILMEVNFLLL